MTTSSSATTTAATRWSLVAALPPGAAGRGPALTWLCRSYWDVLRRTAERLGHDAQSAEDAVQSFLVAVIERGIGAPDRERGRFRTFVRAAFRSHAIDLLRRASAAKRGGGVTHEALPQASQALGGGIDEAADPAADATAADGAFDRDWARLLLTRAFDRLAAEQSDLGSEARMRLQRLHGLLSADPGPDAYAAAAAELVLSVNAVRVAVFRLRRRLAELIRAEIAETLDDPTAVDDELRQLLGTRPAGRDPAAEIR